MRREETFSVGEHVVLDIQLPAGSILCRSSEVGVVSVSIDASGAASVDIDQVGDSISIVGSGRARSARFVIDVPTGTDVNVKGTSVDVTARGALGALRVRAVSGDVSADDLVRADVTLASGDMNLDLVRSNASLNSTSGDVTVRSVGGRLVASLKSGDLEAAEVGGECEVESASGDVTIGRCGGSSIAIRTLSGDIRLGLPPGIRVDPEISTLSGRVSLPQPAAAETDAPRRSVKVRLRSISGDVRIDRAE